MGVEGSYYWLFITANWLLVFASLVSSLGDPGLFRWIVWIGAKLGASDGV
jgi:hypothetical protein